MSIPNYYPSPTDTGRRARFYDMQRLNRYKSDVEQKPVYDSITMVEIVTSGSSDVFSCPVRPKDIVDFPQSWAAYQGQAVEDVKGTPLEKIEHMTSAQAIQFMARGIRTAEQLASITDGNLGSFGRDSWNFRESARKLTGWSLDPNVSEQDAKFAALMEDNAKLRKVLESYMLREEERKHEEAEAAAIKAAQEVCTITPVEEAQEEAPPTEVKAGNKRK